MEGVQAEVDQRAGHGFAVHRDVAFRQVPAARAHHQHRGVRVHAVMPALGRRVVESAGHRVAQVDLAVHLIVEAGRRGILEVRHEHLRTGVQRVDDHLAFHRTGDLHAAVTQCGRDRPHRPVRLADRGGVGAEIRQLAGVPACLARPAGGQQFAAAGVEAVVQVGEEGQRARAEDRLLGWARLGVQLHSGAVEAFPGQGHGGLRSRGRLEARSSICSLTKQMFQFLLL